MLGIDLLREHFSVERNAAVQGDGGEVGCGAIHRSSAGLPAATVVDDHNHASHGRVAAGNGAAGGGAAMMAALIFAISTVTLFMFFVSYCRSMMASAARQELSEEVRDVTGIRETASAKDYALSLIHI